MTLSATGLSEPQRSRLAEAKRSFARWYRVLRGRPTSTLRTTVAILKAQQEATLDGILVVDPGGRVLSYNRRFLEIWGLSNEAAEKGNDDALLAYAAERVADWDAFIGQVNYLYAHKDEVR